jgi:acyl-lipid (7-3)-desaturase (Delta-4 desaturase)
MYAVKADNAMLTYMQVYIHVNKAYLWYLTAILGLFYAFIGLNIQHDANHGSISRNPMVNRILGLTQNWIGGSSVDWIHQHVVQHHIHTNDLHHDPDIMGNALVRLNPLQPLLKYHMVQHVYIFLLIAGFGFSAVLTAIEHLFTGKHKTYMSSMLNGYRVFEFFATIPFLFRWVVIPALRAPSVETFLNIAPMFMAAGFYLAFFFIISHNFEGVQMFDKSHGSRVEESFLYNQVVSSCNVGGGWLATINGGLNYQIEHHLFPRISHTHYSTIAPVVREFCEKKNIPYTHFPTISENITSTVMHLYKFGNHENPVEITTNKKVD